MGSRERHPKGNAPGHAERAAKAALAAPSAAQQTPLFCLSHADRSSRNAWVFKPSGEHAAELLAFLCDMGKLTWAEILAQRTGGRERHRKHHDQDTAVIEKEARGDLQRLQLDNLFGDTMFRFRLSGEKRLWGFRVDRTFHVVWWDHGHAVYSTDPE